MFEYALPVDAAAKPDDNKKDPNKDPSKDPNRGGKGDDKKVVHTQAKPEKPGDDLGYDPKIIPVEEIPD